MIQLIVFIIASILLSIIFCVILIFAIIKKTKRLFILAVFSFLLLFGTGMYTLYSGLEKGKDKAAGIARKTVAAIFPTFDSDTPDTEANKKNFRHFLEVDITPDVNNIYCFDDAIGIDADYMFSFNCDSRTAEKIIERHGLKKGLQGQNQEGLQHDFFWWDKKRIRELTSYSRDRVDERNDFHQLFWFDEKNRKAYYFEYTL